MYMTKVLFNHTGYTFPPNDAAFIFGLFINVSYFYRYVKTFQSGNVAICGKYMCG